MSAANFQKQKREIGIHRGGMRGAGPHDDGMVLLVKPIPARGEQGPCWKHQPGTMEAGEDPPPAPRGGKKRPDLKAGTDFGIICSHRRQNFTVEGGSWHAATGFMHPRRRTP